MHSWVQDFVTRRIRFYVKWTIYSGMFMIIYETRLNNFCLISTCVRGVNGSKKYLRQYFGNSAVGQLYTQNECSMCCSWKLLPYCDVLFFSTTSYPYATGPTITIISLIQLMTRTLFTIVVL